MTKNKATIIGFLIVPLVSASIGAIAQTTAYGSPSLTTFFGFVVIFYLFSTLPTILFGVPIFLIFNRYNLISWWSTLGSGLLVGALVAVIFVFPNPVQISGLILMSTMGATSGFVFWLIWRFGSEQNELKSD